MSRLNGRMATVKKFHCKHCRERFRYVWELSVHSRRKHKNTTQHECQECGVKLKNKNSLGTHIRQVRGIYKFGRQGQKLQAVPSAPAAETKILCCPDCQCRFVILQAGVSPQQNALIGQVALRIGGRQ